MSERFAVSNVSLSSSGDSIDNSNHELLTSQIGLTRLCRSRLCIRCTIVGAEWTTSDIDDTEILVPETIEHLCRRIEEEPNQMIL